MDQTILQGMQVEAQTESKILLGPGIAVAYSSKFFDGFKGCELVIRSAAKVLKGSTGGAVFNGRFVLPRYVLAVLRGFLRKLNLATLNLPLRTKKPNRRKTPTK